MCSYIEAGVHDGKIGTLYSDIRNKSCWELTRLVSQLSLRVSFQVG